MKRRVVRHAVTQPLDPSYRFIALTQGQVSIVDADDFERVSQFLWYAQWSPNTKTYYARRDGRFDEIWMHRFILGTPKGTVTDHRDRDTLNNRKFNLRCSTYSRNSANKKRPSNNKSGFMGVEYVFKTPKQKQGWKARIMCDSKRLYLGTFEDAEEAARVYDEKAKELFGEFAHLNFPKVPLT